VYTRPIDKDLDRVTKKDVNGVGPLLAMLKEGAIAGLANGSPDGMEEGEEPTFTLAEEMKRQIRREERKKRELMNFKMQKTLTNHRKTHKQLVTPTKHSSFPDFTRMQLKVTCAENSKFMAQLNVSGL